MKLVIVISLLLFVMSACQKEKKQSTGIFDIAELNKANRELLEVVMEDGFSPPISSRVYVYPHIAHYLALHHFYPDSLPGLAGKLNGLTAFKDIDRKSTRLNSSYGYISYAVFC